MPFGNFHTWTKRRSQLNINVSSCSLVCIFNTWTSACRCARRDRIRSYSAPHFLAFEIIRRISSYSVRMRENADQNNSEYGVFTQSASKHKSAQCLVKLKAFWRINLAIANNVPGSFDKLDFSKNIASIKQFVVENFDPWPYNCVLQFYW